MESGNRSNLAQYEKGIQLIELATRNGLELIPSGTQLGIRPHEPQVPGYDEQAADIVITLIKRERDHVKAITSDPESMREALCKGQEALSDAFKHGETLLDLFDRLEKAYRIVFPGFESCIHGDSGCPRDSVVLCTACSNKGKAFYKEASDAT
jgi:hypothetical protein